MRTTRLLTGAAVAAALAVSPALAGGGAGAAELPAHSAVSGPAHGCPKAPSGGQFSAPGRGRTVALTFDDGPGGSTAQIIRILRRAHVTATFFNLGDNESGAHGIVRTEVHDSFALGDHTWDHQDLTTLDSSGQAGEIDRARSLQSRITGHYTCLFRPPYGSYDATTKALLKQRHMSMWLWSVDTEDWKADGSGSAYWVNRITRRADAGGSQRHPVILMHNQPAGNPATVSALPRVIHYYKAHNYTFVDVLGNTGAPTISRLRAPLGARSGGEKVTIHGRNFRHVTTVLFGRERAPFRVLSPRRVVATAPRHPPGRFHVRVVSSDHGRSAASRASVFRYVGPPRIDGITPSSGPTTGGQKIRVDGSNFFDVKRVRIGRMLVAPNRVVGSSRIWLTTPAHRNPATLDVRVTTRFGASPVQAADQYTYEAPAPAGRS